MPLPACPPGWVDGDGSGGADNDDNGDCRPLTPMRVPDRCRVVSPAAPDDVNGSVRCDLVFVPTDGTPYQVPDHSILTVNPACLRITRTPYPRLMVNLGEGRLTIEPGLAAAFGPAHPAVAAHGDAGWYTRWPTVADTLPEPGNWTGLQVAGNWYGRPLGNASVPEYDPRVGLGPDHYPTIRQLRARLLYQLVGDIEVRLPGDSAGMVLGPDGVSLHPQRSSLPWPEPRSGNPPGLVVASGGPDVDGSNRLPAFRLQVVSYWRLWLNTSYERWHAVEGNYEKDGARVTKTVPVADLPIQTSFRVWTAAQDISAGGFIGTPYCNASASAEGGGYLPIPVMEGQSVLVK